MSSRVSSPLLLPFLQGSSGSSTLSRLSSERTFSMLTTSFRPFVVLTRTESGNCAEWSLRAGIWMICAYSRRRREPLSQIVSQFSLQLSRANLPCGFPFSTTSIAALCAELEMSSGSSGAVFRRPMCADVIQEKNDLCHQQRLNLHLAAVQ